MTQYEWWVYIVLALPGIFLFIMNWGAFINNIRGKKFVSGIPLIGGLWIAVTCLISPCKWLALAGVADPGIWLLVVALFREFFPFWKKSGNIVDEDRKDENNDAGEN